MICLNFSVRVLWYTVVFVFKASLTASETSDTHPVSPLEPLDPHRLRDMVVDKQGSVSNTLSSVFILLTL